MMSLTHQQSKCFSFIKSYLDEKGEAPSYTEIADAIGVKSKNSVNQLLGALETRGVIRRMLKLSRAIEVVPEDQTRSVTVSADLWAPLIRYCIAERVTVETAVAQFVRDGLESA